MLLELLMCFCNYWAHDGCPFRCFAMVKLRSISDSPLASDGTSVQVLLAYTCLCGQVFDTRSPLRP